MEQIISKQYNNFIFISKIKEHLEIKEKLIYNIKNSSFVSFGKNILTDWSIDHNIKRNYSDTFFPIINKYCINIKNKLYEDNSDKINLTYNNFWFQIYNKDSLHDWHVHGNTQFANVYYLKLPDKKTKTVIKNVPELDLEEGDLLTFPSFMLHKSPINENENEKIVIAFNISFD